MNGKGTWKGNRHAPPMFKQLTGEYGNALQSHGLRQSLWMCEGPLRAHTLHVRLPSTSTQPGRPHAPDKVGAQRVAIGKPSMRVLS